jgi:hypothetical protein
VRDFDPQPRNQNEEQALDMVRTWAEEVLRQVRRVREVRERTAQEDRNFERLEDWSPTWEEVLASYREQFAAEHLLVWSAHQLERWDARLRRERGQQPRAQDQVLKLVRDALEHLDEAHFDEGDAVPPPPRSKKDSTGRALRDLPGGRLPLTLGASDTGLGGISSRDIRQRALAVVGALDDELEQPAVAWYLETLAQDAADRDEQ